MNSVDRRSSASSQETPSKHEAQAVMGFLIHFAMKASTLDGNLAIQATRTLGLSRTAKKETEAFIDALCALSKPSRAFIAAIEYDAATEAQKGDSDGD